MGETVDSSKGEIKSRIHGEGRVWGAPLELARPAENPQIFRVGGRVGERIACKNNCTREGWGRCPKGASSSGVSLLGEQS